AWFDGEPQILFLSDAGLIAVEPTSGKVCWQYEALAPNMWRAVQPMTAGAAGVVLGSEDLGLVMLNVTHHDDAWSADERWKSKAMKPGYNDFVVYDGFAY